jgi:DNA-binding protein YbaB
MFDKFKQLKKLRDLQKSLGRERMDVERNGVKVTINGNIEIESVQLNPALDQERQEKAIKDCINDAVKKIQFLVAGKMQEMGNLGLGNLGL